MRMTIRLLGEPAILDAGGVSQPVRGYQAWALLARVVLSRAPLDRRGLAAELFPEAADPLAALRWCLASLRNALATSDCLLGDPIARDFPADITIDVRQIEDDDFDIEAAGPLLLGIEPRSSPEFATWLLVERERMASAVSARLRREILKAIALGDADRAIRLAAQAVHRDPYDEGAHILLVRSLVQAGRHDAALSHVEATEALFAAELGERPTPALRSAARRSIAAPPAGIAPATFVRSLITSGLAALSAGAVDAGVESLRRAVDDAEKIADAGLAAEAMFELGTALVHAVRGYDDEGSIILRSCAELALRTGATELAASAYRELGYVEALAGRRPAAEAYLAEAGALALSADNRAGIHAVAGFNLIDWGRIDDGLEQHAIGLELARAAGNARREIWSLGIGAWGLLAAGRPVDAESWLTSCLSMVEAQRWIAFEPWPVALQAEARLRQGAKPASLRPALEAAFALSCQLADRCWQGATARTIALTYAAENDFARASDWIADARIRCTRSTDTYVAMAVEILASEVEISLRQNRLAEAERIARDWVALAARSHMDAHVARAATVIAGR